jgi:hypothetical protein
LRWISSRLHGNICRRLAVTSIKNGPENLIHAINLAESTGVKNELLVRLFCLLVNFNLRVCEVRAGPFVVFLTWVRRLVASDAQVLVSRVGNLMNRDRSVDEHEERE